MSTRADQPEPFLRGVVFPQFGSVTYPRADPSTAEFMPSDMWQAAQIPAGLRIEFLTGASTIEIGYRTETGNLGYRGEGAGTTFSAYRSGQKVSEAEAVLGDGVVQLPLSGDPQRPVTVYLPEGMKPVINYVTAVDGSLEVAPKQPRWLAYGDAMTQGWLASSPSLSWPAVAARKAGLDLCNIGYAGSARAEATTAQMIARIPLEVISVSYGVNCWERIPHSPGLMAESLKAFVGIIRRGHPATPIIVVSPTLYPEAEQRVNVLGSTMADLRTSVEAAVRELMAAGDSNIRLVEGMHILSEGDLVDGIYPGDEGHKRIAAAVGKYVSQLSDSLKKAADERFRLEESGIADELVRASEAVGFMEQMPLTSTHAAPAGGSPAAVSGNGAVQQAAYHEDVDAPVQQHAEYANVGGRSAPYYQQGTDLGAGGLNPGGVTGYPGQGMPGIGAYAAAGQVGGYGQESAAGQAYAQQTYQQEAYPPQADPAAYQYQQQAQVPQGYEQGGYGPAVQAGHGPQAPTPPGAQAGSSAGGPPIAAWQLQAAERERNPQPEKKKGRRDLPDGSYQVMAPYRAGNGG